MMKKNKPISEDSASPIKINRNRDSGKKRLDLFARLRNTEHPLDNIFPDAEELPNNVETVSLEPIQGSQSNDNLPNPTLSQHNLSNSSPSNAMQPDITQQNNLQSSVSPNKDYQKVANSITRNAIPNKVFKGTSKNTYDVLYLKTRGAINPSRFIEATKRELMKWTGVSHVTIFKHIKHLEFVGMIKVEHKLGSHDGSVYEVFIPEEIQDWHTNNNQSNPIQSYTTLSNPSQPTQSKSNLSEPTQSNKIASDRYNNAVSDSIGNVVENKDTYGDIKTHLKTLKEDVEGFAGFIEMFQQATEEITGRRLSIRDEKHLVNLAELLVLELKIAARRTDAVSSVPAFLTEVLRRKLRNLPTPASKNRSKTKPDTVGKSETGEYEVKPLSKEEREAALIQLKEFAEDNFLNDFEKWYTEEDWTWLIEQLGYLQSKTGGEEFLHKSEG